MFSQGSQNILAVLDDTNFYLIECTPDHGHRILQQAELRPEHRRMTLQPAVVTLSLERDTGTIKCFVDGTEYINLSGIELPLVERFGFAGVSRNEISNTIFNKVERRFSR